MQYLKKEYAVEKTSELEGIVWFYFPCGCSPNVVLNMAKQNNLN